MYEVSVIVCTYNPVHSIFKEVLDSLKNQSLASNMWELLIVDNNSKVSLISTVNVSRHLNTKIIVEEKLGLAQARLTGVSNAKGSLIVFVDDDNVLDKNYLTNALQFYNNYPQVGSFGGKSIPVFATAPPGWFYETGINLGCQDYGDTVFISNFKEKKFTLKSYPEKAPIGTGMVIQKKAFMEYIDEVSKDTRRLALGRRGKNLTSGEDNDIILTIIKKGYEIAYVPSLIVHHLIPASRYSKEYLQKMAYESNRSWIRVLEFHGIKPWTKITPASVPLRKIKSYITLKAWLSSLNYIKWKAACGLFEGRSLLR